ncbi:hypothetical protein OIE75_40955 (plasmid) [Streptomyces sp. NBC_01723]|uniref:hypothetical protein n=1 Tax=Streptomyces sp. NBC_01723 TaxID=2975921 RepID=UPI002E33B28A|nr:hypothetical protein [Streptomyces sp. NBC_01723]
MRGHDKIHSLIPDLDPATRAELDKQLTILEADTVQAVLQNVETHAGDHTAKTIRNDCYPHLDAMLRGDTPAPAPDFDVEAFNAAARTEAGRLCTCNHYRDKHARDFVLEGKPIRCWSCDCMAFTDSAH